MGKIIAIIVVLAAIVGVAYVQHSMQNPNQPGAVVEVVMPDGALQLEPGTEPWSVIRGSMGGSLVGGAGSDEDAADSFVDWWIPRDGWNGEVRKVVVDDNGVSTVSMHFEHLTLPGFIFVICELPGGHPEGVKPKTTWDANGRISAVEISDDPLTKPHRIIINPCWID